MSTATIIVLGVLLFGVLGIVGYFIMIYNGLISLKENIKKSWSNIDVILKQRYDELPKLISVCESFAQFEKSVIDRITKARENYGQARTVSEKSQASGQVSAALSGLFAIAENYPELKSNENFMQLQGRISHLEESLADRREFYNDSVNLNNVRIEQFPDMLIARFFNFGPFRLLEFSEPEKRDVDLASLFR